MVQIFHDRTKAIKVIDVESELGSLFITRSKDFSSLFLNTSSYLNVLYLDKFIQTSFNYWEEAWMDFRNHEEMTKFINASNQHDKSPLR